MKIKAEGSRTQKSIRNVVITLGCQIFAMVVNFAARKCFIMVLNNEYLGISSLFTTILTMLSLVELGLAPAMVFSMYKPLAEKDYATAGALMKIYKKAYLVIGCLALAIGWAITPFIHIFISEMPKSVSHIHLIYMMFVFNTGVSYFFSYKRSLLTADQNQYVLDIYHNIIYFVMNLLQIGALFLTRNYFVFLSLQIIATIVENLLLSRRVDKSYPWLKRTQPVELPAETKKSITKNVKAMAYHRIGGLIVDSTDNILISKMFGLGTLALYSNYLLITKALTGVVYKIFSAVTASIGNLRVTSTKEHAYEVFETTQFINFWIFCFSAICLFILFNPFIESIWLGGDYVLSVPVVFIICLNFYIDGMRRTVLTFKEAFGLPWQDRYKPLIGALVNLVVSIALARVMGLSGIFYGTLISNVFINVWWEAKVVYKHGFEMGLWPFIKLYLVYFLAFVIIGAVTYLISRLVVATGWLRFALLLVICAFVPNALIWICFHKTKPYKACKVLVQSALKRRKPHRELT